MSSKENRMLFLFLMVVINVFGLIAGIFIGLSQILINSRYGFIGIIFMVTGIADYYLMKYRDARLEERFLKRNNTAEEEYDTLKTKCDAIEAFRNSFPYKIADGYVLYNIMRVGMLVGNASTWQIVGNYHGDLWKISVVRPHTQSYKDMITLVAATQKPDEITELNQSDTLFWQ